MDRQNCADLLDVSRVWLLDGDLMTCRSCGRSLVASRDGEALHHKYDCENYKRVHPWKDLRIAMSDRSQPSGG